MWFSTIAIKPSVEITVVEYKPTRIAFPAASRV
jgi:hypothetical protein